MTLTIYPKTMHDSDRRPETLAGVEVTDDDRRNRAQFLLSMYKATWDNINRHILVVWQSITALFAALAALYLSGKELLSPDFGSTLIVVAAGWSIAQAIDSTGWYNRNLLIIGNIERQFLFDDDSKHIHYFFGQHRGERPIEHLAIQMILATTICALALLHHFTTRVIPGFGASWRQFDVWRTAPYIGAVVLFIALRSFYRDVTRKYRCLVAHSPGRPSQATPPA